MLDAHLLFPPPWSPFHSVHLALPLLKGHLIRAGLRATTTDLNVAVTGKLLRREVLEDAARRLEETIREARADEETISHQESALAAAPFVIPRIDGAVRTLKDPGDRLELATAAVQVLRLAGTLLSAADHPASWDVALGSYRPRELVKSFSVDEALRALERRELDVVERALRDAVLEAVRARPARLYGFGLACSEQLFPALRCAAWIHELDPAAKIVIGGAAIPFMERIFPLVPRFFDRVDFVVVQDGEEPLRELLRATLGEVPLAEVPNLYYRDGKKVVKSARSWSAGFDAPAAPDFGDVDLGAYLARPSLPYLTGRRCYWNRCTFCSITYDKATPFAPVPVPAVVDQLASIAEKTGCRTFTFVDEVVPAPRIRRIADAILERGLDVTWDALLRFEEKYDEATFERAYRSGMRACYFGLESASEKVLALMEKGYRVDVAERDLRLASRAGLYTHCFVMFGFPGEEEADYRATVDFCLRNAPFIDSIAAGHFTADLCSPCGDHPQSFGLDAASLPPLSLDHRLPQGEEREGMMLSRLARFREETLGQHWSFLGMGQINAGNLLDRLRRRGMEGFRELQVSLAQKRLARRRVLGHGPHLEVRLSPALERSAPFGGEGPDAMLALYEPHLGVLAILPVPVVELARRGASIGALDAALSETGAAPGIAYSLLDERIVVEARGQLVPT